MHALFWPLALALAFTVQSIYAAEEFVPMESFAEGQSLSGANTLNDSLYVNPAGSGFTNVYSVQGTYGIGGSFAASVLDTKTGLIGGSLGYFRRPEENPQTLTNFAKPLQGVNLGLSAQLVPGIALGVAGKSIWGPDMTGADSKYNDVDVGILGSLGLAQLGLAVHNVFGGSPAMDLGRELTLGGRIGYKDLLFLSVATDSYWSQVTPYQYGIGAEYVSPYHFSLQGGYRIRPSESTTYWTVGFSINSPVVSLLYAAQIPNQKYGLDNTIEHLLGITLLL
jgi:hypothetical protein